MNCCLLLMILLFCSGKEGKSCTTGRNNCKDNSRVKCFCEIGRDTCGCGKTEASCSCDESIPPCPPPPMPRTQFPYLDSEKCGCENK